MPAASTLLEFQRHFLDALYDDDAHGPLETIAGNGLGPSARLRIYRHSCESIQIGALQTAYPAILALVGEEYFDQAARGFRRSHPSRAGNLQTLGAGFGDYLEALVETRSLPYLGDVARLEWLRQQTALAADAQALSAADVAARLDTLRGDALIALHPSLRLFVSAHAVLAIWQYAMHPVEERLTLPPHGETVALWRDDGDVAVPERFVGGTRRGERSQDS